MRCPKCGSTDLRVDARVTCEFHDAGSVTRADHPDALITPVEEADYDFDHESTGYCADCSWEGVMAECGLLPEDRAGEGPIEAPGPGASEHRQMSTFRIEEQSTPDGKRPFLVVSLEDLEQALVEETSVLDPGDAAGLVASFCRRAADSGAGDKGLALRSSEGYGRRTERADD